MAFFLKNNVIFTFPLEKPFSTKKLLSIPYQALGVCLRPYKAFFNLKTWLGKDRSSKLGG